MTTPSPQSTSETTTTTTTTTTIPSSTSSSINTTKLINNNGGGKDDVAIEPLMDHLTSSDYKEVYEPAEDSFLFIDSLLKDYDNLVKINPHFILEIGSGSGFVISYISTLLGSSGKYYMATDLNPKAAIATMKTSDRNNIQIDVINTSFTQGIERFHGLIDVLLFNPPYVPTPSEEISLGGIAASWAGGINGREVIDLLLPKISTILSDKGYFYIVLVAENKPKEVVSILKEYGYKHKYKKVKSIENRLLPPGPTPIPILGNLLKLAINPHLAIQKLSKIYGGAMTLYFGKIRTVVLSDPDFIKEVFINQSNVSTDRFLSESSLIIGNEQNILFSNGDYWKKYRFILASALSKLKLYPTINTKLCNESLKLTDAFSKFAKSGELVNPIPLFKLYTLNVIMEMLLGQRSEYDSDKVHQVIESLVLVERELSVGNVADLIPILKPFFQTSRSNLKSSVSKLWEYCLKSIETHRKAIDHSNGNYEIKDLLDLFITEINKSENPSFFENHGLMRVCSDLLLSGTETSSSTIAWLFLYLINNPEMQEKVHHELVCAVGDGKKIELSHRGRAPFLNACIKEALRIRPVGALSLPRIANTDINVGQYLIPEGTQILMNVYGLAMDPDLWKDPETFNPYRWLVENNESSTTQNEYKFIPFGCGPRACVGSSLAKDEIFLGVGNLLLNYKFETETGKPVDEDGHFGIALSCKPYNVRVTKL
eukprot:gene9041-11074_t